MVHTIGWFIEQALSVLAIFIGIWIFGYLVKNGTGAVKDIVRTIGMTVKTICLWIRGRIITKIEEEKETREIEQEEKKGKHEPQSFDDFCREYGFPTKEEFEAKVREKETLHL